MQYSNSDLIQLKKEYIQKQANFKQAFLFQVACLNKINKLYCVKVPFENYSKSYLYKLFTMLDRRLIKADQKLQIANIALSKIATLKQFEDYVAKYQINEIDKDLDRALRVCKKIFLSNIKKGFVYNEVYASLEQTSYICGSLYYNAICQLQYCIDFIDRSTSNSLETEKIV